MFYQTNLIQTINSNEVSTCCYFFFHRPPLKSWLTLYIGWGHNSNVQWVPRCSKNKLELWKSEVDDAKNVNINQLYSCYKHVFIKYFDRFLIVSLRHLAKGAFYTEVGDTHGISRSSYSRIVHNFVAAVNNNIDNIRYFICLAM